MIRWKQGLVGFMLKGAVICVSFAVVFVVTYRLNQDYLRQAAETATVVTAGVDLLPGEPLQAAHLLLSEKHVFALDGDYIEDIDALLESGPWYVGDLGFGAGDVLRPGRLLPAAETGGERRWEFQSRERVRLVAVETTLVRSSGDWLWPGMLVDAMVYIPARDSYDDPQPSCIIGPEDDPLLGGLMVIDKKNANGLSLDGHMEVDSYSRDLLPAVVTLILDEGDTERAKALIRYNEEGRIYFSPIRSTRS